MRIRPAKAAITTAIERIERIPLILLIMMGFGAAYVCFFIVPIFLSGPRIDILHEIVPSMGRIGSDLQLELNSAEGLLQGRLPPFPGYLAEYPPLTHVVMAPLLLLEPSLRYPAVVLITLIAYTIATFVFPLSASPDGKVSPALILVFVTGLLSYGLVLELERGQYNVIAWALALTAIRCFHASKPRWLLALILLCVSIQLKLSPMIFVFMLVSNWTLWRDNLRRLAVLAAANFALFFVLGPGGFTSMVRRLSEAAVDPEKIRFDNHSIYSFSNLAARAAEARGYAWASRYAWVLEVGLVAIVGACFLMVLLKAYRAGKTGLNSQLLMACALVATLLPAVSHDYTITLLGGPAALMLTGLSQDDVAPRRGMLFVFGALVFAFAYASTLIPLGYKPGSLVFGSNFPALLVMLIITALITTPSPAPRPVGPQLEGAAGT